MKKRFLSIVLAVLMLVGILPISAIAADAEAPESNITAVKSAQWVEGRESEGIAKVTIQVSGKAPEEWTVTDPTDIVLVMDRSLSMDDKATSNDRYDKMTQAKNAAKQFAQKMLESDKVRIAVVMYTKTAQTVKGQNQDAFSNAYATVENRINSITTEGVSSENSGTNTQAGIHAARELLKASTAKNKIMIVLSDGQPNYSFPFVATADYVGCERWFKSACEDNGPRNGYITNIGSFIVDYNSYINEYGGFNLNYGNARITVKCKEHGTTTENFDYGVYNGSTYNGKTGKTDHSVATIWEAGQAEKESVEIYSIGFGIGSNQNAIKTMKGIASAKTEDHYFSAGMSANDIEAVFNSIAKQVSKYVAYKPIVTDTISNDFEYYTDATLMASAGEGDTITPNGQTVTWDLAAEQLDTTEHTLTFYVKYKNIDNPAAPNTNLPTNAGAQLKYAKEENGQATETQNIANASVPSLSKTVSYIVTGQAPSGYTKPDDAYVWVGHEYTVADVPETASAEEGTYTFEGWKANGEPASSELEITADITLTGEWKFEAAPTTMDITITKVWDDSVSIDRYRSAKIWLYANGEQVKSFYARQSAGITKKTSTTTFEKLPVKDASGKDIVYTVKETEINDRAVTSDNQLVTEDEIWTGAVTGNAVDGFTVTNSFQKNERRDAEVTKTATRTRGNAEPVPLPQTGGTVREGDIITYTVKVKNKGNVAFSAGDWARDYFTAAGTLVGEDGNIQGGGFGGIIGFSTLQPDQFIEKQYTYQVLAEDEEKGYIANVVGVQVSIPGSMNPLAKSVRHEVTVEKPHGVTYTFDGYDTLPEAVQNLLPTQDTNKKYYKGDSVTLPTLTENTKTIDGIKYTFAGWYVGSTQYEAGGTYTMGDKDVTFVGKWTKEEQQPETTTITVKKEWRGLADGATKPEVEMTLWQSTDPDFKVLIENAGTLTLNGSTETTPWTGVFENVRLKNDEDEPLYYFVSETEIGGIDVPFTRTESVDVTRENEDGSITVIGTWHISREKNPATNTWTITNRYEDKTPAPVEKISITVEKRWDKNNSESVVKPNEISVQLTQNGVNYGEPVELSAANNWTYTFTELLETDDNGEAYNYSVKEPDLDARDGNGDVIGTWKPLIVQTDTTITITNTFVAKEPEPELEDHEFTAHIVKRFENKSGKSPKATFTFVAALDDGTNVGRATISFSKGEVDAGDFERKDETMTVKLTDSQYEALEKDRIGRYLWIYEEDGEVDGVKYDTEPKKAYIYEKPVAWSLEFDEDGELVFSVPDENTLYCLVGDEMVEDFVFTNTYKKPGEKGETIKSGPQLNRDDHVAYIMGYPDGTVQPKGEITRAEACTIFFRLLTESSRDYYFSKTNDYTDVNAGDWFNNAISTLSNAGIVTGYNDGTFRPNQPITRGEMAKIIANFANLNKGTKSFTDLSGHWSKTYVELAAGNGWIAGYPDGSFRPDQKITRAETVTMINRVLERVPAKELRLLSRSIMLTFPDNNPGDWYYIAIQEASNSHEYQRSVYETTGDEMWTKLIDNVDWTKLEK